MVLLSIETAVHIALARNKIPLSRDQSKLRFKPEVQAEALLNDFYHCRAKILSVDLKHHQEVCARKIAQREIVYVDIYLCYGKASAFGACSCYSA